MQTSIKISELVTGEHQVSVPTTPTPDPLQDQKALHEANCVSMLYTPLQNTFAMLFDLRTAMYVPSPAQVRLNTGVLVVNSVSSITGQFREMVGAKIWLADTLVISSRGSLLHVAMSDIVWGQSMFIQGLSINFFWGFVEGIVGEVAAEIEERDTSEYRRSIPSWQSWLHVEAASYLSSHHHSC